MKSITSHDRESSESKRSEGGHRTGFERRRESFSGLFTFVSSLPARQEGFTAFFRGFFPALMHAFPLNAAVLLSHVAPMIDAPCNFEIFVIGGS